MSDVMTALVSNGTLARWARALSLKNGSRDPQGMLGVEEVITEHLVVILTGGDPFPWGARNALGALYSIVQRRVENYFLSGEVTGMISTTGLARRKRPGLLGR